jgi:geranylgeranyl pyrophosphate synthase
MAADAGFDLKPFQRDLAPEEINDVIDELRQRHVIDNVRAIAIEHANLAKKSLSLIPRSEERDLLTAIVDYFIARGA